ncbi:DUF983 domain-containing protein [Flavobacterium branchiophilum]|uniref:DUF983 domain-containing protein n=2 Tax=Flavobacterium branchiophilum TaxID=55197 RepID=G2Z483_FLABF|nr:DUF983 domain-containing protein [Flavobacterium branchiophilum]PDS25974.1 DUF983 domain-containing protein [Flavobacterium branchiophilum]CCB70572.1 Protein of unknown function [Flavobacterium branchiophilum FL-15]
MLKKGSKLYSIFTGTCPQCQKENMYVDKNLLHFSNILKMNDNCSHCGLQYQIEPSFFYGAMYVSYGLNVAVGIATFIIAYYFLNLSQMQSFFTIIGVLVLSFPMIARMARNIYINIFIKYDKKYESNK